VEWTGREYQREHVRLAEEGLGYLARMPNRTMICPHDGRWPHRFTAEQSEMGDVKLMWHRRVLSPALPRSFANIRP